MSLICQNVLKFEQFIKCHSVGYNYIELGKITNSYTLQYYLYHLDKNTLFNSFYDSTSQFKLSLSMTKADLIKAIIRELHCRKNYLQNCLIFG